MKKIILILIIFLSFTKKVNASYIVMDMDNKITLFEQNKDEKRLIASTSKIMTAIIAIENGNLDEKIKVDKEILKAVGSSIYIEIGESLTLRDLLYGLMLRSGNDAAVMIANNISGSMESFASKMNEYAKKLGMLNTNFINSHGLENNEKIGNISTAYDMALLTSYAYQNSTFRKIFKTKHYECKSDKKTYVWNNKNKLLKHDFVTGGKTGYTIKAKRTLVTTANINNMNIVIVTLNDPNDFNNHLSWYKELQKSYKKIHILHKGNLSPKNIFTQDNLYIKKDFYYIVKNEKDIEVKYYLFNKDNYKNTNRVGIVKVFLKNKLLYVDNIYIKKQTKNKVISWFKRLLKCGKL